MIPFTLENLRRVNRIVVREDREPVVVEAHDDPEEDELPFMRGLMLELASVLLEHEPPEGVERPVLQVSLFIGKRQVVLGAPKQKNAKNGEFTTDLSGLRLVIMFLEAIGGMSFRQEPRDMKREIYEFRRSDLRVAQFPGKQAVG